ncbi:MAG: helix-turn-helix domain-containing protein [Bacteroidales bacterium]
MLALWRFCHKTKKAKKMKNFVFQMPEGEEILQKLAKVEEILNKLLNEKPSPSRTWLNTAQAAKKLGVTPRTLQNYRDKDLIPYTQFGREIRYLESDLDQFLRDHYVKVKDGGQTNE